jgi:hypothetical protein
MALEGYFNLEVVYDQLEAFWKVFKDCCASPLGGKTAFIKHLPPYPH